jgi:hypothetical protein
LYFRQTGRLAPGCDNRDLQEFYEKESNMMGKPDIFEMTYEKVESEEE